MGTVVSADFLVACKYACINGHMLVLSLSLFCKYQLFLNIPRYTKTLKRLCEKPPAMIYLLSSGTSVTKTKYPLLLFNM